jgi:hypothetical protein
MPKIPVGRDANDKEVLAEPVDFTAEREEWNVYKLSDGATLRFKAVVTAVLRTDLKDEFGQPIYVVRSQNATTVRDAPPVHEDKQ